ncbi:MAG: hypothetical protein GOVbin4691_49 [Prokaryotic dsDNA virus sp.]|jgi:hypothetical protein|nr:MAG: hypothetical protein GOVbin4691_49 [Prokaryotic dsDNA virus sp.]|tara:strand:- start:4030 stop:4263 length:234 start_codon:yes stop_codon:yes gene_type:complete
MIEQSYKRNLEQELKNLPFELSVNDMGMIQYYYNYFIKTMGKSEANFTPVLKERINDILSKYNKYKVFVVQTTKDLS